MTHRSGYIVYATSTQATDVLAQQELYEAREEHARNVLERAHSSLIGTALVDITDDNKDIKANEWNTRPVNEAKVKQFTNDFSRDGIDLTKDRPKYAVFRGDVSNLQEIPRAFSGLEKLPRLQLRGGHHGLWTIQGGHRRAAASRFKAQLQADLAKAEKSGEHSKSSLDYLRSRIESATFWAVDLYDYGKCCHLTAPLLVFCQPSPIPSPVL